MLYKDMIYKDKLYQDMLYKDMLYQRDTKTQKGGLRTVTLC